MIYYHPRLDILAVKFLAPGIQRNFPILLEYTDDGHGVFVLTPEWICVGSL